MKHLFYIHSFVTYLVALGVIEHEQIHDNDVGLVCGRQGVLQDRFNALFTEIKYSQLAHLPTYGRALMYIKYRGIVRKFDKSVSELVANEKFICYIPANNHFLLQLLITHRLCCGVKFIEEGLFSYNSIFFKKNWPFTGIWGTIKRYLNTGFRNIKPNVLQENALLYTLFDPSYYHNQFSKKCVMPNLANISYSGNCINNSNLLLLNSFRDASDLVINAVLNILKDIANECSEIYVKHHPYSDIDFKTSVEHTLKSYGVNVHVLPDSTETELMLFKSQKINIYGFFSASMLYGALFGHSVNSFVNRFKNYSNECASYLRNSFEIPEVFINNVNLL